MNMEGDRGFILCYICHIKYYNKAVLFIIWEAVAGRSNDKKGNFELRVSIISLIKY